MSKNILDQIKHCCDQLERFSLMFLNKTTDSAERIVQFGYNLGRLMVLTRILNKFVYELNSDLKNYSMSMAQMILNKGLTDTPIDQELIDYGFAIGSLKMYAFAYILTRLFSMSLRKFLLSMKNGYLQESFSQNHELWWKPISTLCAQSKWKEVAERSIQTLNLNKYILLQTNYIPVFDHQHEINWANVNETIQRENEKIRCIF